VTLHKLRLPERGVFWDIGAGSGSLSIEAARLSPGLRVFAVEKDEEQIGNIGANIDIFNTRSVEIVRGTAPEALQGMPVPDRVFIGGSGGRLREIVDLIRRTMPTGIVVVNATTIETLSEAVAALETSRFDLQVSEVSVSRSKTVGGKKHMSAMNPVFIITGERTEE
jgi:precorrin-6Y C5,15-methyltransferase (decarboxylating) CbiT subunit